jgi:four helix bundle protein
MVWLLDHTSKFPKHERFRLARQIEATLFDFHEELLRASNADSHTHLAEADIHLNKLRTYLRLAVELKYTTPKQYEFSSQATAEIGKLLGGWLKKA